MLRSWMSLWVTPGIVKLKSSNLFFHVYCPTIPNIHVVYLKSLRFYLPYNIPFGRSSNDVITSWSKFSRVFNIKRSFSSDVPWECKLNQFYPWSSYYLTTDVNHTAFTRKSISCLAWIEPCVQLSYLDFFKQIA